MAVWDDYKWKFWDPAVALPETPSIMRKVSICTTCMGRLKDLQATLVQNIKDNSDYPNVEFVVLDYNSNDGLYKWMIDSMRPLIDSGIVVYYRTTEPQYYNMGHSRNVAFKLATGDIINNVDADNFTKSGFASFLNIMAEVCTEHAVFCKGKRSIHGRAGFYKKDFIELGGYDEDLDGYGFDDHNIIYRAMALGYTMMWWGVGGFYDRIHTPRGVITTNYSPEHKSWRKTEEINKQKTFEKLNKGQFVVNQERHWGKATVIKNFSEIVSI